jgi:hypothetical protein
MSENKVYEFDKVLHVDIEGVVDADLKTLLAKALIIADSKEKSEILKYNEWIDDLIKDGKIQLSGSDKAKLETFIEKSTYLNARAKGEIFKILSQ